MKMARGKRAVIYAESDGCWEWGGRTGRETKKCCLGVMYSATGRAGDRYCK